MKQAKRNDKKDNKPGLHLLPTLPLEEIAKVLDFGTKKYGEENWRLGLPWKRCMGSCLRHIFAWMRSEDLDSESNLHHLAHAGCNILFILEWIFQNKGEDDRYKYN